MGGKGEEWRSLSISVNCMKNVVLYWCRALYYFGYQIFSMTKKYIGTGFGMTPILQTT